MSFLLREARCCRENENENLVIFIMNECCSCAGFIHIGDSEKSAMFFRSYTYLKIRNSFSLRIV